MRSMEGQNRTKWSVTAICNLHWFHS